MAEKNLNDLFLESLRDIYHAERQILRKLPKIAKAATSEELQKAFMTHKEETERQIERIEQIFEMLGKQATGKSCEAVKGMLEESDEVLEDFRDTEALDAGIVASTQTVEHYEISRYGTLKAWAKQLGMRDAEKLLDETLKEEMKTDQLLTKIAERSLNPKAAAA
jgi:ferritin-like metal-binding protein YciE